MPLNLYFFEKNKIVHSIFASLSLGGGRGVYRERAMEQPGHSGHFYFPVAGARKDAALLARIPGSSYRGILSYYLVWS